MASRYQLQSLSREYKQHKHHIHAYLRGESVEDYVREDYDGKTSLFREVGMVGWLITVAVVIIIYTLAIWFLVRQWTATGVVGAIISLIVLFIPGLGPLASIIITLIASTTGGWGQKLKPIVSGGPVVSGN